MKKLMLFVCFFGYFNTSYSQKAIYSIPIELSIIGEDSLEESYSIEGIMSETDYSKFKIIVNDSVFTFELKPFTYPLFASKFRSTFKNAVKKGESIEINKSQLNELGISKLFASFATTMNIGYEQPPVANISLRSSIPLFMDDVKSKSSVRQEFRKFKFELKKSHLWKDPKKGRSDIKKGLTPESTKKKQGRSDIKKELTPESTKKKKGRSGFKEVLKPERTKKKQGLKLYRKANNNIVFKDLITIKYDSSYLEDAKVELSFYKGFIEKIEVEGYLSGDSSNLKIRFSNLFSIGVSSMRSIENFDEVYLKSYYKYKMNSSSEISLDAKQGVYLLIRLSDVIDYDRIVDINANDISPMPTKLILDKENKTAELKKEESTKILEAVVYSDFLGLFNEENPNGILQTEVSKHININTNRLHIRGYDHLLGILYPPTLYSESIGLVEYINVKALFSKIEGSNKFIPFQLYNSNSDSSQQKVSPVDVMQRQFLRIGADCNLITMENQNRKINTYLDFGIHFGRTGVFGQDSVEQFVNSLSVPFSLMLHFVPEKRYGFIVKNTTTYMNTYNPGGINIISRFPKPKESIGQFQKEYNTQHWFNSLEFKFYVETSTVGKLFARYIFNSDFNYWDDSFSQFQFGYSFYLLKRYKGNEN